MSRSITKISDAESPLVIVVASGADHDRVAAAHPEWDAFDWCWYWELDARKGYKKAVVENHWVHIEDPGRRMDCGDALCKCKQKQKVTKLS